MKKHHQIKKLGGAILLVLFLLTSCIPLTMGVDTYEIRIETDQEYYYPGEQVLISIQLLKNGQGYPGGVCPEVRDPEETLIFGGLCYGTDEYGYLNITDFYLDYGAMLGTYLIYVHGYADMWEGYQTKNFEVVSETIIAEANGPYQGQSGQPIQFYGDVSGGKPPYSWYWQFGDDGFSYDRNPTHTYLDDGTFNALLTVTDQGGRSDDDSAVVIIQGATYDLTVSTNQPFYFTDEKVLISGILTQGSIGIPGEISLTITDPSQTVVVSTNVPTNEAGEYETVFYPNEMSMIGEYTIFVEEKKLHVANATSFDLWSATITADAHGPYEGKVGRSIDFSGDASGGLIPYTWYWDFNDNTNSSIQNPTHIYEAEGIYTVTLVVNDSYGHQGIDTAQVTVTRPVQGNHTVFIEEGTATWCVNCPAVAQILHDLYKSGEYNFYYVSMVQDKNDKAKQRLEDEYNILGYPTVYVDGGYQVVYGDQEQTVFEEALEAASTRTVPALDVNLTTHWNETSNTIETSVVIQNLENVPYQGVLRVYLTEINSRWADNCGNTIHNGFLDFMVNEEITIPVGGQVTRANITSAADLNPTNLMVFAAVFNGTAHQGYSNPPSGNPFDAYYTDATVGKRVLEGNLPPEVGISNPQCGRFHLFGKSLFTMPNLKTVVVGRINIAAIASDETSVEKVEFYLDDVLKATLTSEPYEWMWKTPSWLKAKHTIKVMAYDNKGDTTTVSMDVTAFIFL